MTKQKNFLIGKKVVEVRAMTKEELIKEDWGSDRDNTVIVFDTGDKIYASSDEEGNAPGELFGQTKEGQCFIIYHKDE